MKKILFVTTNNLATNPRLLKEIRLALKYGGTPTVVLFDFNNWTTEIEKSLRASLIGVNIVPISATRKAFIKWAFATILQILCKRLNKTFINSTQINAYASDKRSFLLRLALKQVREEFDLVIAHNLGALYPASNFAKQRNIPYAFDVEDYHPGESIFKDIEQEVKRREILMKSLLPNASYISYASPLIGEASIRLVPQLQYQRHILINNSFSSSEFILPIIPENNKLSFVWFSQNIAPGRGLEIVVPILYKYRDYVELTLIGHLHSSFFENFLKAYNEVISYKSAMPQKTLHRELANFDIGLAVELNSTDTNRNICLTNKIFAYSQAGLFILATNTRAQELFIRNNPVLGVCTEQYGEAFEEAVLAIVEKKEEVRLGKLQRYELGKCLAWEIEAEKLLEVWKSIKS